MRTGQLEYTHYLSKNHTLNGVVYRRSWAKKTEKKLGYSLPFITADDKRTARAVVDLEFLPDKSRYINALSTFWKMKHGGDFPYLEGYLQMYPDVAAYYIRKVMRGR